MSPYIKVLCFALSGAFISCILYLLAQRRLNERHTIYWLLSSLVLLFLSLFPQIIDYLSQILEVSYPPTLLFFLGMIIVIFMLLYQSVQVTNLHEKVLELSQYLAILELEIREHNKSQEINSRSGNEKKDLPGENKRC